MLLDPILIAAGVNVEDVYLFPELPIEADVRTASGNVTLSGFPDYVVSRAKFRGIYLSVYTTISMSSP